MRLFFGIDIHAPWPENFPEGRVLAEADLHLTLAFLGEVEEKKVSELAECPLPSFLLAPFGYLDKCLFLPKKEEPRVVSWHLQWKDSAVSSFQKILVQWLAEKDFSVSTKPWLSHVTVCRAPFNAEEWQSTFQPLPCYAKAFHLFESLGHSTYRSLCSKPFQAPFEEIEHTADIAFAVYGNDLSSLYEHAALALSFVHPPFFSYVEKPSFFSSLEDIIIELNRILSLADAEIGCPFKAVSFHGEIEMTDNGLMKWEMIVDV